MRDYGKISTSLWMSRRFRSLKKDDQARLLYVYLHTCVQVNSIGCFVLPKGYAKADLNWSDSAMDRAIIALRNAGLIDWNEDEDLVRIVDFLEHDPCTNPKHAAGSVKLALALPDCAERACVIKDLNADLWAAKSAKLIEENDRATIGLSIDLRNPEPEPEPEPEPDIRAASILDAAGVADFENWWEQYPRYRRGAKEPCRKKFLSLIRRRKATARDLLDGLGRYNAAGYFESAFACGPAVWLNEQRWTIERFPAPGDKSQKPAQPQRYSNSSLARSLLQETDDDHDRVHAGRDAAAVHRPEGAGERDASPLIPEGHLRLAGPDEAERD